MPNKEFLENYPLYKKMTFDAKKHWERYNIDELSKPSINMSCPVCDSLQTYNMINSYAEIEEFKNNHISIIQYKCTGCHKDVIEFFVKFDEHNVYDEENKERLYVLQIHKVGQFPSWSVDIDRELEKMLGKHSDYYKKGLVCESQSYGIGAYAYFRRITEDVIDELLNLIFELIEGEEDKEKYSKALEEAKKTKVTEKKIELVKDLLPASLRADNLNPLKALHSALSVGLHGLSDERCMEQAEIIRTVLVYLVNQIIKTKNDKKIFTDGIRKLLVKN